MDSTGATSSQLLALKLLDAHGTYLSDADETEIVTRTIASADVADLAVRTCMCGLRVDGFDNYHDHLRQVLSQG